MAKIILSTETAFEVADDALHIFGGYGYIVENQIEHSIRAQNGKYLGEVGGTQKKLIAKSVIGKI